LNYPSVELAMRFKETRAFKTLFKDFPVFVVEGISDVNVVKDIYKSQDPNHRRVFKVQ
jgi:hypothetical protein